jgi:importin subunit alpha-6/7
MWGISYMSAMSERVVLPALKTLGNITNGDDAQTQAIVDLGFLPVFLRLLDSEDAAIRKETCWTLSNIWAGNINQVASIIEVGILDKLVCVAVEDCFEIQKEAGWCISNTTAIKDSEIIKCVVQKQGLQAILAVLKCNVDPRTAVVLLEGVMNILEVGKLNFTAVNTVNPFWGLVEECGGLDIIESYQSHLNQKVYQLSVQIIEKYFSVQETDIGQAPDDPVRIEF